MTDWILANVGLEIDFEYDAALRVRASSGFYVATLARRDRKAMGTGSRAGSPSRRRSARA